MSRCTKTRSRKIRKKTFKRHRKRMTKRQRGGAAQLPMIIDKNNVTYSCTANPSS